MEIDTLLRDYRNDVEELRLFRTPTRKRLRKTYRARFNPLQDLSDEEFRVKYRFSKTNMCRIIDIVKNDLQVDTRGGSIPVELQVMAVITYWGHHEIQEDCADMHGMSQQTLSRLASKVAMAFTSKSSRYIKMPSSMTEEANTMNKFEAVCGLRGIDGVIDCTRIKLKKIGGDVGQDYIDKTGFYSINTQLVCDADQKICDIVCRKGSTHDSAVYRESSIKRRFEENEFTGVLIGDGGYPCTPHLITPIPRPSTEEERQFNYQHIETLKVVENCFNIWKQRFRILLEVMRGSYATVKNTIIACAVLHNLAIIFNEEHDMAHQLEAESVSDDEISDDEISSINRHIFIKNNTL